MMTCSPLLLDDFSTTGADGGVVFVMKKDELLLFATTWGATSLTEFCPGYPPDHAQATTVYGLLSGVKIFLSKVYEA